MSAKIGTERDLISIGIDDDIIRKASIQLLEGVDLSTIGNRVETLRYDQRSRSRKMLHTTAASIGRLSACRRWEIQRDHVS